MSLALLDILHSLPIIAWVVKNVPESVLIKTYYKTKKQRFGKIGAKIYPQMKHLKSTKPANGVLILISKLSSNCWSLKNPLAEQPQEQPLLIQQVRFLEVA